jgi:hypothetical protein
VRGARPGTSASIRRDRPISRAMRAHLRWNFATGRSYGRREIDHPLGGLAGVGGNGAPLLEGSSSHVLDPHRRPARGDLRRRHPRPDRRRRHLHLLSARRHRRRPAHSTPRRSRHAPPRRSSRGPATCAGPQSRCRRTATCQRRRPRSLRAGRRCRSSTAAACALPAWGCVPPTRRCRNRPGRRRRRCLRAASATG